MRSNVMIEKFCAVLKDVALAPRVVNDLPAALYAKYAFASIPDALTLPSRVGDYTSKLAIVPKFASECTS